MSRQGPDHTLQPTALVHEAFLRIVDADDRRWQDRRHFLALAAQAMRAVLVDHARARATEKRGRGRTRLSLDEGAIAVEEDRVSVLALDEALSSLAAADPRLARIVELRYFAGMTVEETSDVLGISERTVKRGWRCARIWLRDELLREDSNADA